jgi:ABC-type multidrug transport system permease subunit
VKYIDLIKSIHVALFASLQVILILIIIYFFCSMFNRMKKDMLSSHTMIGMLPKHLLQRKD